MFCCCLKATEVVGEEVHGPKDRKCLAWADGSVDVSLVGSVDETIFSLELFSSDLPRDIIVARSADCESLMLAKVS